MEEAKRNVGNIYDGLKRSSDRMDVEDMIANEVRCFECMCPFLT